ncbi:MAG: transposase [Candidatus Zixiibacteriota bacterium]|nr:MAG: transposase [candidate division Zixibacteria bacterium]
MPVIRFKNISGPAAVFITTTVIDWTPVFSLESAARVVCGQLNETSKRMNIAIIGYVVMPSHLHFVGGLKDVKRLSNFMKAFKSLSSRKILGLELRNYKNRFVRNGKNRFWMRRFDDLIIYSEKQLKIKLEYIHNNPVREGLTNNAINWKYSSAGDWLGGERGVIDIVKDYSWLDLK